MTAEDFYKGYIRFIESAVSSKARIMRVKSADVRAEVVQEVAIDLLSHPPMTEGEWKALVPNLAEAKLRVLQRSTDFGVRGEAGVGRRGGTQVGSSEKEMEDLLIAKGDGELVGARAAGLKPPPLPGEDEERAREETEAREEAEVVVAWKYIRSLANPEERVALLLLHAAAFHLAVRNFQGSAEFFEGKAKESRDEEAVLREQGEDFGASLFAEEAEKLEQEANRLRESASPLREALQAVVPPRALFDLRRRRPTSPLDFDPRRISRYLGVGLPTLSKYESRLRRAVVQHRIATAASRSDERFARKRRKR